MPEPQVERRHTTPPELETEIVTLTRIIKQLDQQSIMLAGIQAQLQGFNLQAKAVGEILCKPALVINGSY